MLKGIDVSENNGYVDWNAVKAAGMVLPLFGLVLEIGIWILIFMKM